MRRVSSLGLPPPLCVPRTDDSDDGDGDGDGGEEEAGGHGEDTESFATLVDLDARLVVLYQANAQVMSVRDDASVDPAARGCAGGADFQRDAGGGRRRRLVCRRRGGSGDADVPFVDIMAYSLSAVQVNSCGMAAMGQLLQVCGTPCRWRMSPCRKLGATEAWSL